MKILWDSQNPPVSQQELDRFEDERGVQIPQSYRDFIVQNRKRRPQAIDFSVAFV
jgi:hypothetical protein